MTYTISVFIALHIAFIFSILLSRYIIKIKNKKQIHYAYLCNAILTGIWSLGGLLDNYSTFLIGNYDIRYFMLGGFGLIFIPVSMLITSRIFLVGKINFNYKYKLLFVIPIISYLVLLTNKYHNLYYETFSIYNYETVYGKYFNVHAIYSYICLMIALWNFILAGIRNSKLFSKQSIVIIISCLVPLIINVLFTYKIFPLTMYITCVCFAFTILCTYFAILKYGFLDISPISMRKVMDSISDAFIIIDSNYKILDYNATFYNYFGSDYTFNLKDNFEECLKQKKDFDFSKVIDCVEEVEHTLKTKKISKYISNLDRHFEIEFIPIIANDEYLATSILLKDVTQHVKDMELIKQSQDVLMEQERLVTLGQLAGGMAHDINTPLSAIATGFDYFEEILEKNDETEIMINAGKKSIAKISSIVNSVRDQIRNLGSEKIEDFEISKVLENLEALLFTELRKNNCKIEINKAEEIFLTGDVGKLEQVVINIVLNAIQAYENKGGLIKISSYKENECAIIEIEDEAGGIPEKIAEGLLKQIVSTKGARGTGFGLYFSNSIIKGVFKGELKFETELGSGTTFYIVLPLNR